MSYLILLLAAHPQWQSWAADEIRQVMGRCKSDDEWTYKEVFPKLKRTLALIVRKSLFTRAHLNA